MSYFLWGCRGILTLITLRSESVKVAPFYWSCEGLYVNNGPGYRPWTTSNHYWNSPRLVFISSGTRRRSGCNRGAWSLHPEIYADSRSSSDSCDDVVVSHLNTGAHILHLHASYQCLKNRSWQLVLFGGTAEPCLTKTFFPVTYAMAGISHVVTQVSLLRFPLQYWCNGRCLRQSLGRAIRTGAVWGEPTSPTFPWQCLNSVTDSFSTHRRSDDEVYWCQFKATSLPPKGNANNSRPCTAKVVSNR